MSISENWLSVLSARTLSQGEEVQGIPDFQILPKVRVMGGVAVITDAAEVKKILRHANQDCCPRPGFAPSLLS